MFTEKQLSRYADVLLWGLQTARKRKLAKNDLVLLRFDLAAVRLAEILYAKLLEAGAHPLLRMNATASMEYNYYALANDKQLVYIPPGEETLFAGLNGSISIYAPESLTHLSTVDPKRIGKAVVAKKKLRDLMEKRENLGKFSWTLCIFPTAGLAKHARISQKSYSAQIARACFLNTKSPVAEWQRVYKAAQSIKKWLNRLPVSDLHVESENVDLRISLGENRKWVGISGRNIPSFEIFVSPDWRGTRGVYYADQPSYRSGNYVKDVHLKFEKGRLVKIGAAKGQRFVAQQLRMDQGAGRLGEFSLTDTRFSRINTFMANTLFDENYGGKYGNCHIALGSSYSNTYSGKPSEFTKQMKRKLGFNQSALHWDFVNTEKKRVSAHLKSGKKVTIYEDGKFKN
ncbi:MAG: aminopeptidase [Desulfobacterales bacterium]|jgi:aminopeptidase